mmetsp:Transcript_65679/g.174011  ORF Transcript_65679/g.174011 Transcript_65679/m.174011 type:complete len:220 (-) Transcript_65679:235-894(-)
MTLGESCKTEVGRLFGRLHQGFDFANHPWTTPWQARAPLLSCRHVAVRQKAQLTHTLQCSVDMDRRLKFTTDAVPSKLHREQLKTSRLSIDSDQHVPPGDALPRMIIIPICRYRTCSNVVHHAGKVVAKAVHIPHETPARSHRRAFKLHDVRLVNGHRVAWTKTRRCDLLDHRDRQLAVRRRDILCRQLLYRLHGYWHWFLDGLLVALWKKLRRWYWRL